MQANYLCLKTNKYEYKGEKKINAVTKIQNIYV